MFVCRILHDSTNRFHTKKKCPCLLFESVNPGHNPDSSHASRCPGCCKQVGKKKVCWDEDKSQRNDAPGHSVVIAINARTCYCYCLNEPPSSCIFLLKGHNIL
ncbi:unnamed protein product [Amoebophrya sp. A25]|nr:unnamed protein product [Amoebophrya sp. A25]CAD7976946.1 unnamed protein product [Amoebophrya sp. A25]|eukprot:GSA25T00027758001.1